MIYSSTFCVHPCPIRGPQTPPLNRSLHVAQAFKKDEFYTQLSDIEKELRHYTAHFKGKTVLCNVMSDKVTVSNARLGAFEHGGI